MTENDTNYAWLEPAIPREIELAPGLMMRLVGIKQEFLEGLYKETNDPVERWEFLVNGEVVQTIEEPESYVCNWLRYTLTEDGYSDAEVEKMLLIFRVSGNGDGSDEAAKELAKLIYDEGSTLDYMCKSCARVHVGDETAIRVMFLSYAATRVHNLEVGIHIALCGKPGTGKSHVANTVSNHLPSNAVCNSGFSDKALLYHSFPENTVFIIDDHELSEDFQELIKNATSSWNREAEFRTVRNQQALSLTMPKRCPFWIVKANTTGDEQVLDRQIVIWTDDSEEQMTRIHDAINRVAGGVEVNENICSAQVSRYIWKEHIKPEYVICEFASCIRSSVEMSPRNRKLLYALIFAHAVMHAARRRRKGKAILANIEDFKAACKIMNPLLENSGGSQNLKLTPQASRLLEHLRTVSSGTIPFRDIRFRTGMKDKELSYALYGRHGKDDTSGLSGLLGVCPAIGVCRYTYLNDGVSSSGKAIEWDAELAKKWQGTSGIFEMSEEDMERYQYLTIPADQEADFPYDFP